MSEMWREAEDYAHYQGWDDPMPDPPDEDLIEPDERDEMADDDPLMQDD